MTNPVIELRRRIMALRLEVDPSIANDIRRWAEDVIWERNAGWRYARELKEENTRLRERIFQLENK